MVVDKIFIKVVNSIEVVVENGDRILLKNTGVLVINCLVQDRGFVVENVETKIIGFSQETNLLLIFEIVNIV